MELFLKIYFLFGFSLAITKFILVVRPTIQKLKNNKSLQKSGEIKNIPLFVGVFYLVSMFWITIGWIDYQVITLTKEKLEKDILETI